MATSGNSAPGNADVPVGSAWKNADEDVGAPRNEPSEAPEDIRRGWYSRGYLPHCDAPRLVQAVTYRLADSLPQSKLAELREEIAALPERQRENARRKRIEAWLDAGMGCCALAHPEVARYVQNSLLHFHGQRYQLHAWCIMPNHVHVLIEPRTDLAAIVQGWKSYTARWILTRNEPLALDIPHAGQVWMRDYWDRFIRDDAHYQRAVEYIHQNPVEARLCAAPEAWPWSSAYPGEAAPGNADIPVGSD